MRRVYWVLLQLYPRQYRLEFGDEMFSVFMQAAEERRAQGWFSFAGFFASECAGLLGGAIRETPSRTRLVASLGGLAAAVVLHATLYAGTLRVLRATTAAVERSASEGDEQAKLMLLVMASVLWLLFFLLLSMRLAVRRR